MPFRALEPAPTVDSSDGRFLFFSGARSDQRSTVTGWWFGLPSGYAKIAIENGNL